MSCRVCERMCGVGISPLQQLQWLGAQHQVMMPWVWAEAPGGGADIIALHSMRMPVGLS